MIPQARPFAMLKVSGIVISVRKAGNATQTSSQAISAMADIISPPTTTRAGAVAADGTAPISGATNNVRINIRPVTMDVTPVLPPTPTPAAHSMYLLTVVPPPSKPPTPPVP